MIRSVYSSNLYYRPQRKYAKVMFLHVSVCPRGVGGSASVHAGIPTSPGKANPPWLARQTPPGWQGRPPWLARQTPPGKETPRQGRRPCAVHAGRYGQQAGGMHPTGMQFLFTILFFFLFNPNLLNIFSFPTHHFFSA